MVGTAPATRHLLVLDQLGQRLGLEELARHHQVGAHQHRPVGEAPGVGVEHRHDRHHAVAARHAQAVGEAHRQRLQQRRAVRVEDALGVAGRAARVAEARPPGGRRSPGSRSPRRRPSSSSSIVIALGSEPVSAPPMTTKRSTVRSSARACSSRASTSERVHQHDLVLRVVGDVGELLGEQPDVQRVQHRAHEGWPGRPPGGAGSSRRTWPRGRRARRRATSAPRTAGPPGRRPRRRWPARCRPR